VTGKVVNTNTLIFARTGTTLRRPMAIGCSYFGVRVVRHAVRDLEDLSARGYTGVLHTFSENDLTHYRGTFARLVAASHDTGLEVQASPWGLGGTFGGEAESGFVAGRPDTRQRRADGAPAPAACLNHPDYRAFVRDWADAAVDAGVDYVFWDEPHFAAGTCSCEHCAGRAPADSLVDFLRDMVGHVAARGGRSTVCLLPNDDVADWNDVASLPGLAILATDPYWKHHGHPAEQFVARYAARLVDAARRHGVGAQLWLPAFGLTRDDLDDFDAAAAAARAAGVDDIWTWGYEACAHMTSLATPDAELVWEHVTRTLTGGRVTEARVAAHADLDLRSTRELIDLINDEDAKVPTAVRAAAPDLAHAIDAIVSRLERGGRLVYVGAGSSGRLALVDAAECGPTFGIPPEQVVALVAGGPTALAVAQEAAEDDEQAGAEDVAAAGVGPDDAVVALSASGRTPYVLGAARAARAAGALTVGVVCAPGSELGRVVDHLVVAVVGAEVLAGSTRMKAGTAQKLILNTISTVAMVKLGKTYGNLMVDVVASNAKLRGRTRRAVALATGASDDEAGAALDDANGEAKVAIVSLLAGVDPAAARTRLKEAGGVVRRALAER
jgi:N-acetylmuramic acid 6-phosphate etherase